MFTKEQLQPIKQNSNLHILQITDDIIEFRSRNTWHCWMIKKESPSLNLKYPYTIYHKHKLSDRYHHHWQSYSLKKCIESIQDHDKYVLRVDELIKNAL